MVLHPETSEHWVVFSRQENRGLRLCGTSDADVGAEALFDCSQPPPLSEAGLLGGGGFSDLCGIALSQGRELRVVMNTNDPDYEHIYSVESYGDTLDELLYFAPTTNQSDGNVFHTVSGAAVH